MLIGLGFDVGVSVSKFSTKISSTIKVAKQHSRRKLSRSNIPTLVSNELTLVRDENCQRIPQEKGKKLHVERSCHANR
jgi:hypothetical protein